MIKELQGYLIPTMFILSLSIFNVGCWYTDEKTESGVTIDSESITDRQGNVVFPSHSGTPVFSSPPVFPNPSSTSPLPDAPKIVDEDLKVVWEVWQHLHKDYVDKSKLDKDAFQEYAIRGMLTVLEDAQTSYVKPEVMKTSFGDVFKGKLEGIGAHVSMNLAGEIVAQRKLLV